MEVRAENDMLAERIQEIIREEKGGSPEPEEDQESEQKQEVDEDYTVVEEELVEEPALTTSKQSE